MTSQDIPELIERVRAATGPDRELDWRIAEALNIPEPWPATALWPPFAAGSKFDKSIPRFTASIDAALALVERVLPGWNYTLNRGHCELRHPKQRAQDVQAFGPTPALAIIRALLLSLQSEADK